MANAGGVRVTYRESDQGVIDNMLATNGQHVVTVHNGHIVSIARVERPVAVAAEPADSEPVKSRRPVKKE